MTPRKDFLEPLVAPAENAWDFTDPNAMPGFGPLETTEEVRRMIADVVRQIGEAAQPASSEATQGHVEVVENSTNSSVTNPVKNVDGGSPSASIEDQRQEKHAQILGDEVMVHGNIEDCTAAQPNGSTGKTKTILTPGTRRRPPEITKV